MEDKTFAQVLEDLNQWALKGIIDETLHCWAMIQRGATVASATAHMENESLRQAVTQVLFYVLLHTLLVEARERQMIDRKRYEELRGYIDTLTNQVKKQPFMVLPLSAD